MTEATRSLSFRRKLVMGLVAAALVLALVEGVLRLFVPRDGLLFSWERPDSLIHLQGEGQLDTRRNADGQQHDGPHPWFASTNDLGFREGAPTPRRRPPGTARILALGDSFVFGVNADQGKALPDRLEPLLSARLGRPVDVVNMGVPGASAFDILTYWRRFGPQWEHDGLLLGLPHNPARQKAIQAERAAWYQTLAPPPAWDLRLYLVLRRFWAPMAMRGQVSPLSEDGFGGMIGDLEQIAQDAFAAGTPVWLVLWPTRWETVRDGESANAQQWTERLGRYGVRAAGHRLAERSCWGYFDTGHPSEAGYHATAHVLADLILPVPGAAVGPDPLRSSPTCVEVEGDGPGKPGSPPVPDGPNQLEVQFLQFGKQAPTGKRGAP